MMKTLRRLIYLLCVAFICFLPLNVQAETTNSMDCLGSLNGGVENLFDTDASNSEQSKEAIEELIAIVEINSAKEEPEEEASDLFMAKVNNSVNVRTEPNENADKAGLLYKDCGGRILERGDAWTKIQSGNLVGWVSNEFLYFDEEAQALAEDVGFKILTVNTDALRIRKEPGEDTEVLGLVANGDELDVEDDTNPDWVQVVYEGETGFVSAEYVTITFSIDAGESIAEIKEREEREAAEAAEKRKKELHAQQAAIVADGNDLRLLAALIQCEAGTVNHEGQLAVGAVVMNRVRSGAYPNTISGVIYASGQFTPALNGKVAAVYNGKVYDSCFVAAQEALNGMTNVGTATHFRRSSGGHEGIYIGGQVFW